MKSSKLQGYHTPQRKPRKVKLLEVSAAEMALENMTPTVDAAIVYISQLLSEKGFQQLSAVFNLALS